MCKKKEMSTHNSVHVADKKLDLHDAHTDNINKDYLGFLAPKMCILKVVDIAFSIVCI